jgi:hypothetical protein
METDYSAIGAWGSESALEQGHPFSLLQEMNLQAGLESVRQVCNTVHTYLVLLTLPLGV